MMRSINTLLFLVMLSAVRGIRRLPSDFIERSIDDQQNEHIILEQHHRRLEGHPQQSLRRTNDITDNNSPDSHLVTSLPLLQDGLFKTKHWSGHLPAAGVGSDKQIFYWLFEPGENANNIPDNEIPLVIWLNGGPGCSSSK